MPRSAGIHERRKSSRVGHSRPIISVVMRTDGFSRLVMISRTPNRPIASATNSMPSVSSIMPKVKRRSPELMSVPTMPSSRPSSTIATALIGEPCASTTAAIRPNTISEQYSAGWKLSATSVSGGVNSTMTQVAIVPARNEPSAATASAAPALPCLAIWWPSRQVTTEEDSPGRLTRIEVVEPPYCAP
ncbi:MAG: hypothetical protein BGN94_04135 [Rhizobiales bacterium 68-8]|nr:MAG: hypothetical protein BGN94_04135 [Rhizobiales bacterium 68-8]